MVLLSIFKNWVSFCIGKRRCCQSATDGLRLACLGICWPNNHGVCVQEYTRQANLESSRTIAWSGFRASFRNWTLWTKVRSPSWWSKHQTEAVGNGSFLKGPVQGATVLTWGLLKTNSHKSLTSLSNSSLRNTACVYVCIYTHINSSHRATLKSIQTNSSTMEIFQD